MRSRVFAEIFRFRISDYLFINFQDIIILRIKSVKPIEMNSSGPSSRTEANCCYYAHEQCRLAHEQWSRLLENITSFGGGKGSSILQHRTSIDPSLLRLINSAESSPCASDNSSGENPSKHSSVGRRCGLTPWKSDEKQYSPGLEGLVLSLLNIATGIVCHQRGDANLCR